MHLSTRTSLTINKYLEEFPGLVHFIYIDRSTHRLVAPTLDFTSTETLALTMKKVSVIEIPITSKLFSVSSFNFIVQYSIILK